jgi:hypothetical protein
VSEFVEECLREWKRLRVPDPVANEMAADLAADLKEAEAEGRSAEEVLGSGAFDPKTFAASWAAERGVMRPRRWDHLRRRPLLIVATALLLTLITAFALGAVGLVLATSTSSSSAVSAQAVSVATAARAVAVPDLVGLTQDDALRVARASGFAVRLSYRAATTAKSRGVVLRQRPTAGSSVAGGSTLLLVISR